MARPAADASFIPPYESDIPLTQADVADLRAFRRWLEIQAKEHRWLDDLKGSIDERERKRLGQMLPTVDSMDKYSDYRAKVADALVENVRSDFQEAVGAGWFLGPSTIEENDGMIFVSAKPGAKLLRAESELGADTTLGVWNDGGLLAIEDEANPWSGFVLYRIVPLIRDTFFENCAQDVPYMGCQADGNRSCSGRLRTLIARYPIRNPPVVLHVLLMASVVDRR